jgi:hypothetical protein
MKSYNLNINDGITSALLYLKQQMLNIKNLLL